MWEVDIYTFGGSKGWLTGMLWCPKFTILWDLLVGLWVGLTAWVVATSGEGCLIG